jgi:saccharopine dehydrogenase-like NADP-dependent oxidoreductase
VEQYTQIGEKSKASPVWFRLVRVRRTVVKILVLGTGLQGRAALYDLMHSPCVTHIIAADVNTHALEQWLARLPRDKIQVVQVDARDEPQVARLMQRVDAVIVLLPTTFHVAMARLAIANGIHLINSSYAPPEFQEIGRQAASRGLAILPEFGLDPGIDLVLAGHTIRQFDTVYQFYSYGAGFPEPSAANNPLRYKISWTFDGVLKAYRRDARIVRDKSLTFQGERFSLRPIFIALRQNGVRSKRILTVTWCHIFRHWVS